MRTIYGTITEFMGTAYTGAGVAHKYDEIIKEAERTVFLKCPPTHSLSPVLDEAAALFIKKGHAVDKLMNPAHPKRTDAIFVRDTGLFILQASHPVAMEPSDIGGKHAVVSFYDQYDEERLQAVHKEVSASFTEAETALQKSLQALTDALSIHDEWEAVNVKRMMWKEHAAITESVKAELFGTMKLHKKAAVSHRVIGSLSSGGAKDFIPSITKSTRRRILLKGLSGSGKSTMLKAVGQEAERRGIDVLYGWCGLDPKSVDLVLLPELSVCLFDATKPHEYDPESARDEVLDLVSLCEEDEQAEKQIEEIAARYKEKILDASGYMHAYANAENRIRTLMDQAICRKKHQAKIEQLRMLIGS